MHSRRSVLSGALVVLMMSWNFDYVSAKPAETPIKPSPEMPPKICLTKSCVQTASKMLDNLDETVDPCENFYRFACGGYHESITFSENYKGIYSENESILSSPERVIKSLEKASPSDEPRPLKLVKDFFRACMNTSAIEKQRTEFLLEFLKETGGWPILEGDKWNEDDFNWLETIFKLSRMGYNVNNLPKIRVDEAWKNGNELTITVTLHSDISHLKNLDEQFKFIENMINISKDLGVNNASDIEDFKDLHDFIEDVSKLKTKFFTYNSTVKKLGDFGVNILTAPWKQHIKSLFPSSFNITDNEVVVVVASKFIESLAELMTRTPKRVQANYLMWNIISQFKDVSVPPISDGYDDEKCTSPVWKFCYDKIYHYMPVGLYALYVRSYFDNRPKQNTNEMIRNMLTQFNKTLQDTKSLNPDIKERFINKIGKMSILVGYPDEFFNSTELDKLYQHLEIYPDNYIRSRFNAAAFQTKFNLTMLRKSTRGYDWQEPPNSRLLQQSASYSIKSNNFVLPATYFQGFMKENDNPQYLKYGVIGSVIGHEMYHAFDSTGRDIYQDGNEFVWNDSNKEFFNQSDQCFINQYGKYSVGDVKLDGYTTFDENFADNGGLKIAHSAYLDYSSNRTEAEFRLPGLERYNNRQMFWISAANSLCSTTANLNSYNLFSSYAPNEYRTIGSFSNMPEFAKDFDCPVNSMMNPEKKCSVWTIDSNQ